MTSLWYDVWHSGGRRDHLVVGFTTTCAISAYHNNSCEFEPHSWRGVLDTTLCDKVCQWFATGRWFSPGTQISTTKKADRHDLAESDVKHHKPPWYSFQSSVLDVYYHYDCPIFILMMWYFMFFILFQQFA